MGKFTLAARNMRTVFCVERSNRGLVRVASFVAQDLKYITGQGRMTENNIERNYIRIAPTSDIHSPSCANADVLITAGIIGDGSFVNQAAQNGLIDISPIIGKRECYRMATAEVNGKPVVIIAATDLLGAEYGLLKLSELAGVSPWYYWGDVTPSTADSIDIAAERLNFCSKQPAVRLRGFFMNDEWPSLGGWVHTTFGGFNELFYEKVFDLLLRLRGNFLWPAMWSAVFSEDGRAFPTASAELAAELGIIMGTSHHEPLFRAGEEFSHTMTDSNDVGYGCDWSYYTNQRGLYAFWEDGVQRNRDFPSLITVGMRGERDSKILGDNATLGDNIELLKRAINDQKQILSDNGLADAPKVLALYKEVEDYYYGDQTTEGLRSWSGLDDIMLLLSDDNFGNTRTLPTPDTMNRPSGWGLYYHFDYHGDPISYEWVNSTPITKAWEQLTMAYDYGIRELWVANVGDLRPCELPLSYFIDLAFDYDKWSGCNKTADYLERWVGQQFGCCARETIDAICGIINDYTRLNGDCRPEAVNESVFSLTYEMEMQRELTRSRSIIERVESIRKDIPEQCADRFTGLVAFPALASANLRMMIILSAAQKRLSAVGAAYANTLCERVGQCIERDKALEYEYNHVMSDGKWVRMMSSKHVAFVNWNDEGSDYPKCTPIELRQEGVLLTAVSGCDETIPRGRLCLPPLSSTDHFTEQIYILGTGKEPIEHRITASDEWICVNRAMSGDGICIYDVSADWDRLSGSTNGTVIVESSTGMVEISVEARVIELDSIPSGTFVESRGVVCMAAEHYSSKGAAGGCEWTVIDNYGKSQSAVKCLPNGHSFEPEGTAPYLEYSFYITNEGQYTLTAVIAPTNNLSRDKALRCAVSTDGEQPTVIDTLPEGYCAGVKTDSVWSSGVLRNERRVDMPISLSAGLHTVSLIAVDAGVVLQKLEIAMQPPKTFYGYRETYRKV